MKENQTKNDVDPQETQEWLDALLSVHEVDGAERVIELLKKLRNQAELAGVDVPIELNTPYVNTLPVDKQVELPEDNGMFKRLLTLIRWNAVAMVLRAGKVAPELGGHIATYASAATLYEVGFNHFFKATTKETEGDLVYIQGHSSPGIYARAFLEGRLSEQDLDHFRQEVMTKGLSSYPHPWLMPDFWQFATVSMGLGPIQGIYQARFLKYLQNRGLAKTKDRKVWVFVGDGEVDEPESLGAISLAGREQLNNLVFVINCNLQRLDGPVRGNSKIIQELERVFHGANWRVLKVIWGRRWDPLLEGDQHALLVKRMHECVDGDYQNYKSRDGAYVREHFFGKYPELAELVADMSDEAIWRLNRGGHDPIKVYAAYHAAVNEPTRPVVILAKTVKGYGMGAAGEGMNITHQQKKMTMEQIRAFRDRFKIPIPDDQLEQIPFYRPPEDSPEMQYLKQQREKLGGSLPARRQKSDDTLAIPKLSAFDTLLKGTGERAISTTMAFVRLLTILLRNKALAKHIVPIIPDECRTFGMEGLFRQYGIYSSIGQLYEPQDADQIMSYHEAKEGQILEEGLTEAGGFCSWLAAATSYSSNNVPMIPFYIYYSMFGFQRIGDLAWAAGDMRARGFLLGGTAGRTTLAGEGLQHQDGHSHIQGGLIPNCRTYDPTYAYEVAVIIQHGMQRMYVDQIDEYYYLTVMNENYQHPPMPEGVEEGIIKGLYPLKTNKKPAIHLLGSGSILNEALEAQRLLKDDFSIIADVWSVTSFNELARDAKKVARRVLLNPERPVELSYLQQSFADKHEPILAATDYVQAYAEQIRPYLKNSYYVLGTEGFGRSDTRKKLRHFFEVDSKMIAYASLRLLADQGKIDKKICLQARKDYNIDPNKPDPTTL